MSFVVEPIGHVCGGRAEIEDDQWGPVGAEIRLVESFGPDALEGLAAFSHAEILFVFDRVPESKIERGARRPRGRADWPLVGIFAQRGKSRPNRIASTIA
jgi:tRNA (Thr-GGU) A37 N-methylase